MKLILGFTVTVSLFFSLFTHWCDYLFLKFESSNIVFSFLLPYPGGQEVFKRQKCSSTVPANPLHHPVTHTQTSLKVRGLAVLLACSMAILLNLATSSIPRIRLPVEIPSPSLMNLRQPPHTRSNGTPIHPQAYPPPSPILTTPPRASGSPPSPPHFHLTSKSKLTSSETKSPEHLDRRQVPVRVNFVPHNNDTSSINRPLHFRQ